MKVVVWIVGMKYENIFCCLNVMLFIFPIAIAGVDSVDSLSHIKTYIAYVTCNHPGNKMIKT